VAKEKAEHDKLVEEHKSKAAKEEIKSKLRAEAEGEK